jgi:hypothetical protein
MSKMLSVIAALAAAGIASVILYPSLGVTLWVSFLVGACLLVMVSLSGTQVTAH